MILVIHVVGYPSSSPKLGYSHVGKFEPTVFMDRHCDVNTDKLYVIKDYQCIHFIPIRLVIIMTYYLL